MDDGVFENIDSNQLITQAGKHSIQIILAVPMPGPDLSQMPAAAGSIRTPLKATDKIRARASGSSQAGVSASVSGIESTQWMLEGIQRS